MIKKLSSEIFLVPLELFQEQETPSFVETDEILDLLDNTHQLTKQSGDWQHLAGTFCQRVVIMAILIILFVFLQRLSVVVICTVHLTNINSYILFK